MSEGIQMLTIRQIAATGIMSEHALRVLVRQGRIPHVKVGNRALINYDVLCRILQGSSTGYADDQQGNAK